MCYGIALGYVNHSRFEVEAERELEKERLHDRRRGKETTMSGKRNKKNPRKVKGRDAESVSNQE